MTNLGNSVRTVSPAIVQGSVTVDGDDVSDDVQTTSTKSIKLSPGESTEFLFKWNHGDTLNIGDAIEITGCVAFPGDFAPANNCDVVSKPSTADLPVHVAVKIGVIGGGSTSQKVTVQVRNGGDGRGAPLRAEQRRRVHADRRGSGVHADPGYR